MSRTILSTLYALTYLIFNTLYKYMEGTIIIHIYEETKAQKGKVTDPRSHNYLYQFSVNSCICSFFQLHLIWKYFYMSMIFGKISKCFLVLHCSHSLLKGNNFIFVVHISILGKCKIQSFKH